MTSTVHIVHVGLATAMAVRWFRFVTLVAVVVAFISHMPSEAGDSCFVKTGVLHCPGECKEAFAPGAAAKPVVFKLAVGSKLCHPVWADVKRILPGLMVSLNE
jgi:hypothetical protein